MSSRGGRLREVLPVSPGGCLVVEGAGFEAPVQDADEPVRQSSQGVVVLDSAGAELVVEGAGARRRLQGGECLRAERVDQPFIVDEPGGDGFLLAGRAGQRAGAGVVAAGLAVGVAVRVVAELAEHPGAEDGAHAGLGPVDLSVRVRRKSASTWPCRVLTSWFRVVMTAIRDRTVTA